MSGSEGYMKDHLQQTCKPPLSVILTSYRRLVTLLIFSGLGGDAELAVLLTQLYLASCVNVITFLSVCVLYELLQEICSAVAEQDDTSHV
jgi:hypothetical protein